MATNRIHRIAYVCLLSAFLALALVSFFAFGSGRAHAQTVSSTSTTPVVSRIIYTTQKGFQFSPNALTVKSGTAVKIINTTAHGENLYDSLGTYYGVPGGKSVTIIVTQSQSLGFICRPVFLSITVV